MATFKVNGKQVESPLTPTVDSYRQWNNDWESKVELVAEVVVEDAETEEVKPVKKGK